MRAEHPDALGDLGQWADGPLGTLMREFPLAAHEVQAAIVAQCTAHRAEHTARLAQLQRHQVSRAACISNATSNDDSNSTLRSDPRLPVFAT